MLSAEFSEGDLRELIQRCADLIPRLGRVHVKNGDPVHRAPIGEYTVVKFVSERRVTLVRAGPSESYPVAFGPYEGADHRSLVEFSVDSPKRAREALEFLRQHMVLDDLADI